MGQIKMLNIMNSEEENIFKYSQYFQTFSSKYFTLLKHYLKYSKMLYFSIIYKYEGHSSENEFFSMNSRSSEQKRHIRDIRVKLNGVSWLFNEYCFHCLDMLQNFISTM